MQLTIGNANSKLIFYQDHQMYAGSDVSTGSDPLFWIYAGEQSSVRDEALTYRQLQDYIDRKTDSYYYEILALIRQDEFLDDEVSHSELFMREAVEGEDLLYILDAMIKIYGDNMGSAHVLEGILSMLSCVPYDKVGDKGKLMAIGLLTNKDLLIRDRAIRCFEIWNAKDTLGALKSLRCSPKWLQNYLDKVIIAIEKYGEE